MIKTCKTCPPDVHGSCQWVTPNPSFCFSAGLPAGCRIVAETSRGNVEAFYLVRPTFDAQGRLESILLYKEGEDGKIEEAYTVDCSFGPHFTHWCCDCKDWEYRARARVICSCKHTASLWHLFRKIGHVKENS